MLKRQADPLRVDAYLRLLEHVELRLAVEVATSALRIGRHDVALVALESVPCRGRLLNLRAYSQRGMPAARSS